MEGLTKFPSGSIQEVFHLCLPIFLGLLSSCVMVFCDRYFLSQYSLEAFEGACLGGYLALFFQALCMKVVSVNQVFISRAFGEKKECLIGPYTWQMIWFSFLSSVAVIPIGFLLSHVYFSQTAVQSLGKQYFLIILLGNGLFSLGGVFGTFQSGIGKTSILTVAALISNICNFILNYILIFGVEGFLLPLGVKGAALGTVLSQGVYCLILFIAFIKHKNKLIYQIKKWQFSLPLFEKLIRLGGPRAISRSLSILYWVLSVKIVSSLGGDYLLVLSYGGALWTLLSVVGESFGKGTLSLFSFFLGKNKMLFVWKSLRSAVLIFFFLFLLLGVPLVIFPEILIQAIIEKELSTESFRVLKLGSLWLWIYFFLEGLTQLAVALITAMKKTVFAMKYGFYVRGFLMFLPYYLCFNIFRCDADKIWMVNWIGGLGVIFIYFGKAILDGKKQEGFLEKRFFRI